VRSDHIPYSLHVLISHGICQGMEDPRYVQDAKVGSIGSFEFNPQNLAGEIILDGGARWSCDSHVLARLEESVGKISREAEIRTCLKTSENTAASIVATWGLNGFFFLSPVSGEEPEPLVSIDILTVSIDPGELRREMIRVAKRVHRPSPTGNGMSVKLRSRDDFPADCCPTITNYPRTN
jgi:hypothetical protein